MLTQESLYDYYQTNFKLMHEHHYSLSELENMLPWEREIYISLLNKHIKEENEKNKQNQGFSL
jgi:hypothetical protein